MKLFKCVINTLFTLHAFVRQETIEKEYKKNAFICWHFKIYEAYHYFFISVSIK